MKAIFELFWSAGLFGSVMILLVLAARLVLRKAPRGIFCLLWVLVGLRLLIPIQIKSDLSLQPSFEPAVQPQTMVVQPQILPEPVPAVPNATPEDAVMPDVLPGDVIVHYDDNAVFEPVRRQVDHTAVAAWVWAVGVCVVAAYTVFSYWHLKRKLKDAVVIGENVFESDAIDSPFLLGYVKPAVYLPKGISEEDLPYILAHEQCHMDRGDNWFKLAGFLCVGLHWFNPLVWLGYHLLCRDIEMACDEAVVRHMDLSSRKGYSAALVSCSTEHKFGACPVAFGEVSVKQRVLSVLNYRKPGFWISLACVAVIGFTVVCFMTNPVDQPQKPTTQEDPMLRQCRKAIEAIQNADSYYFRVHYEDNDPEVLLGSYVNFYWYNGGNSMFCNDTPDWEHWSLLVDGQYYIKNVTDAMPHEDVEYRNWTAVAEPDIQYTGTPWLISLNWEESEPTIAATAEQNGQRIITCSMKDPVVGDRYMLTFVFDIKSGDLNTVQRTVNYERVGCVYTSLSIAYSIRLNQADIGALIEQQYVETQLQVIE